MTDSKVRSGLGRETIESSSLFEVEIEFDRVVGIEEEVILVQAGGGTGAGT